MLNLGVDGSPRDAVAYFWGRRSSLHLSLLAVGYIGWAQLAKVHSTLIGEEDCDYRCGGSLRLHGLYARHWSATNFSLILFFLPLAREDELNLKTGDTVVDIDKFDKDWWFGRVGARSGIFPSNYVEEIKWGTVMETPNPEGKPLAEPQNTITAMALYDFVACKCLTGLLNSI